jgi:hypothetical protein
MSSASTNTFKKDKNNNLSNKQCEAFIKDYKEYKKGNILNINNPKTGKLLNNEERIKFIYYKCKEKLGIDTSPSKSKSSSSKDNEIILDTFEKVQDIVYIPFNTPTHNKDLIEKLFSKPIKLEEAYNKLNIYLNNNRPPRGQNIFIDSYHDILQEFNLIISTIYHNSVLSADILTRSHGWINGYAYNPFNIWNNDTTIVANIKNTKTILSRMWKDTYYGSSKDIRCDGLNTEAKDELSNILLENQNNHNKDDIIRLLNDNKEKYVALQLVLVLIRDGLPAPSFGNVNRDLAIKHLEIVDSLVTKDVINILFDNNNNNSVSISKSITWSNSAIAPMRSSSSNHSHFQSRANIDMYFRKAAEEKARILDELKGPNVLNNEFEPLLLEEWDDMPLSKLRNIIIIKDSTNKGTAFYIRTLYQYWRNAVKNGAQIVNPYNRRPFTEKDKDDIMIAMEKLYPTIKKPKAGEGRSDITMEIVFVDNNRDKVYINFKYILKMPNRLNLLIELIKIIISINFPARLPNFNGDIDAAYIHNYLFDNIKLLHRNNKTFGKKIPLKPLDVLKEYNGRLINNYDDYKDFFDKIKHAL